MRYIPRTGIAHGSFLTLPENISLTVIPKRIQIVHGKDRAELRLATNGVAHMTQRHSTPFKLNPSIFVLLIVRAIGFFYPDVHVLERKKMVMEFRMNLTVSRTES